MARQAFSDVPPDHPFFNDIQRGAALGLLEGFPDGTFRPDENLTRAQAATLVVRTFNRTALISLISAAVAIGASIVISRR